MVLMSILASREGLGPSIVMSQGIQWVGGGRLAPPEVAVAATDERHLLQGQGLVKITEDAQGTTIRWAMFAPNWSSLYFAAEWLIGATGPFHLQFYASGWFEEQHARCWAASDRIRQLIGKSDVHLSQSVYIKDVSPTCPDMPMGLRQALDSGLAEEDCSVDCSYDPVSHRYRVVRVGPQSMIGRLWGTSLVSYPCLSGHAYDRAVSRVYAEVTRTGEPHYDHVYAAMASARGDVLWIPYQRVVLPLSRSRNRKAVRVVAEVGPVDIQPL